MNSIALETKHNVSGEPLTPTLVDDRATDHRNCLVSPLTATTPAEVVTRAVEAANVLAKIIDDRRLYTVIRGRRFVHAEGWQTCGALVGILPREVCVKENAAGDIIAVVELIRATDGQVLGRASAVVGVDESDWKKRPKHQRRSMALTRATGKAFRMCLGWVVRLAGYEPTPSEEIEDPPTPAAHSTHTAITPPFDIPPVVAPAAYAASNDDPADTSKIDGIKRMFLSLNIDVAEARNILREHGIERLADSAYSQAEAVISELGIRALASHEF